MRLVKSYLRALGDPMTYNPRRNPYLWFGLLWGLPVPVFSLAWDVSLTGGVGRSLLQAVADHPVHLLFLAHPLLFALVFGAMGTVRHGLEEENGRLIRRLQALADTDALTELHNRRYAMEELHKAIHRSRRSGQPVSIVLIDLDGFKTVNDTRGHAAGDETLRRVAASLRSVVRESDVLGRYGGDEFLVVMEGDGPAVNHFLDRASEAMRRGAGMEFSAGTAIHPGDGSEPEELIGVADMRLAKVKKVHHETTSTAPRR